MVTCPSCGRESSSEFAFCPFCGSALGAEQPAPAEVRKTVTVVFCDVTGSTALGERLDPETLRGVMARYFEEMERAVERHGGTVEKFIGDAVMAVFGVPTLHEDDALRAVRAAADMRDAMAWLNKELERDHGVTLAARIGVNTGEVVARQDPGSQRLVTGDAVNVAARLEQAATPGEILVGEPTWRLVRDAVEAEAVEPLPLKGKERPVPAYRLVLVHPHAAGWARRLDSPMVGRSRQLRQLDEAYRTAVDERACYLFTVLGAPGVGKSRLTDEFLNSVGEDATVLRGRCLSYGQGITFFPLVEILGQAAGLGELEAPQVSRDRLIALLGGGAEASVVADRLLLLTGAAETTSGTEELFWAVRHLLESLATERPLVVVIDDIHWAEPTLLDLVEHVADWSRDAPILLVCPARPDLLDVRPGWGGGKLNATTILLEPLTEVESGELLENLLGRAELDESNRRRIAAAAEGNPLFVEQMLAMLIDDGHLEERHGTWVATKDLDSVAVPPTVSALLTARLDRLSPQERSVIERAAVEGKEFHASSVTALSDEGDRAAIPGHLRTLIRRELIRPHGSDLLGRDAYRFRHQLIRDATYESIPKRTRADLHRRFAGWLEKTVGDGGEFAEILGYHLERSYLLRRELGPVDEPAKAEARRAGELLARAGNRADDRQDFRSADKLLSRAIELLPRRDPLRIRSSIALGGVLFRRTEFHRGEEVVDEALADARDLGDAAFITLAELQRATLAAQSSGFEPEEMLELALRATKQFETAGAWGDAATAWEVAANAYWGMARWSSMPEPLERAGELATRAGEPGRAMHDRLRILSAMYYGETRTSEGVREGRRLIDDAAEFPLVRARASGFLGAFLGLRGEFDEAWQAILSARDLMEQLGTGAWLTAIGFNATPVALASGRLEDGESHLRRGLQFLQGTGERGWTATLSAQLAILLHAMGRSAEATEMAALSRDVALPEDINAETFWKSITGRLLAEKGEVDEGLRLAREAVTLNRRTDEISHRADMLVSLAEVAELAGRRDEAVASLTEAIEIYDRKENLVGAAQARARLSELG